MITDAQVHIWDVSCPEWRPKEPLAVEPHRPNGFTAEELVAEMDAIGVDRAVICPPGWMNNPVGYALNAAATYPGRLALMPSVELLAPDARSQLEQVPAQEHVIGIRVGLMRYLQAFDEGRLDWVWPLCEQLGIPVTFLVSGRPGKLLPVAERHPGLTITLDHMGRVPDVKGDAAFAALDDLLSLARFPNVAVKMTSVPDSSAEPYPFRDLYAGVRRIYDAFGAQRMLWGSDLSGLSCTYRECLDHFRNGLDFLSEDDKQWILGKAAATVWNWPER